MNTALIIDRLEDRKNAIERAIAALQGGRSAKGRPKGKRLSAASRRRISQGMKRRWAERKKKG